MKTPRLTNWDSIVEHWEYYIETGSLRIKSTWESSIPSEESKCESIIGVLSLLLTGNQVLGHAALFQIDILPGTLWVEEHKFHPEVLATEVRKQSSGFYLRKQALKWRTLPKHQKDVQKMLATARHDKYPLECWNKMWKALCSDICYNWQY